MFNSIKTCRSQYDHITANYQDDMNVTLIDRKCQKTISKYCYGDGGFGFMDAAAVVTHIADINSRC